MARKINFMELDSERSCGRSFVRYDEIPPKVAYFSLRQKIYELCKLVLVKPVSPYAPTWVPLFCLLME